MENIIPEKVTDLFKPSLSFFNIVTEEMGQPSQATEEEDGGSPDES